MASQADSFFVELGRRAQVPTLTRAHGNIRFELAGSSGAGIWFVRIDRGAVRVSREDAEADCVVRIDDALLDEVVSGQVNAMAAMLRGDLVVEGDPELLVLGQRLFPAKQSDSRQPDARRLDEEMVSAGGRRP